MELDKEINTIRKEQFPELDDKLYFSTCRQGIPPKRSSDLAHQFIDEVRERNNLPLFNKYEKALKSEVASLLGAKDNEITFIRSTSEGLSLIARAIRWKNGDNVIINDLEFMANVIPWLALRKLGVKVKVIHHLKGKIYPSQLEGAIDNGTRAIAIASVQECNGFRCNLEEIGKICKTHGIYFIVDGIQQLGAIGLDVKKANIDFLAAGGHKWLLSPYGAGILYINEDILEELDPVIIGWKNMEPKDFYKELASPNWTPVREYTIRNDSAEKFATSVTDLNVGIPALWGSVSLIKRIGIKNIEKRIFQLTDLFINLFPTSNNLRIISPIEKTHRSGIITFKTDNDAKFTEKLLSKKIICSTIYSSGIGGVRVGINFYNTEEEVSKLCKEIKKLAK